MNKKQESIILFDGECCFCNSLVSFILRRDKHKKFQFIALQSYPGRTVLEDYGLPAIGLSSVVYIKNGHYYLKSSASLFIISDLGGLWRIFYVIVIIPKPIRDAIYNVLAKYRYRFFAKQKSCKL